MLAVVGDLDVDETLGLVEKHFGGIKKRRAPRRPSFAEPALRGERRETHDDRHAPIPAVAIGYRVPDPVRRFDELLAHVLLTEVLTDGDASRLQRRLVQRDHLVTDISAYVGEFGDPFDERDPTTLTISAHYPDAGSLEAVLGAVDEEIDRVAQDGLDPGELDRVRTRLVSVLFRELDAVISRTLEFAKFELHPRQCRADRRAARAARRGGRRRRSEGRGQAAPGPSRRARTRRRGCEMNAVVPALTAPRAAKRLRSSESVLDNGLRVVAVRKPGVPLVEMRLRMPFLSDKPAHPAQASLLADALLTGAAGLDRAALAGAVQALGGDLHASVDADRLVLVGNVLATNLKSLLGLVASVVTDPAYAKEEVGTERDRLVEKLTIARARPGFIAAETLGRRMFGTHPYALDTPEADAVAAVTPGALRALHRGFVRPGGAVLVLVGDVAPARMLDLAAAALGEWSGRAPRRSVPPLPTPAPAPLLVVDRPGSVQTSLRMGRLGLRRTEPGYPALQLANLIFGGYFSSRWTENIREDKGYTYGPHSRVDHHTLGSTLTLDVEVATEVTGPAMLETQYELGRIASLPVTEAEVEAVRQYAIGTLALSIATQAGLASTLSALVTARAGAGVDPGAPGPAARHDRRTGQCRRGGVLRAVRLWPWRVGDAAAITGPLAMLGPVDI